MGSYTGKPGPDPLPAIDRFMAKVEKSPDGCWLWTAYLNAEGYGRFSSVVRCRPVRAHRWAYEHFVGPIAEGAEIDHRCNVPRCVNPDHLRMATRKQNMENRAEGGTRSTIAQSGYKGVRVPKRGRPVAYVKHQGKYIHVGRFDTAEEAAEAARLKRVELFTHNDRDQS